MNNSVAATSEHQLQVVANKLKIGKAERRFAEGKWWLVAPITTIIPNGILNGSKGPGFYPTSETMASVKAWDGMPLTSFHPMDELGRHTSASAPGVLDRQGIGIVRDSIWNNKLQHKGWFDEERTKKVNPSIYHDLIHRIPIETSTGLYTDNEVAPQGSTHNGRSYTWTARNYRPDHVAVLVGQVGACSRNDGCGVLVNSQGLVTNQAVTLAHWVENACECGGSCNKCKPSLNSITINPFVSKSQRRACYAADDPNWDCEEWSGKTKGKLPEKKPGVENLLGSLGSLRTRPSLLQIANSNPEGINQYTYTGAAGNRGKTLHKHSQAAHEAVKDLAGNDGISKHIGGALSTSEGAVRESAIGNHASASKYHLATATQLNQAANKVGRNSFWNNATLGLVGRKGDKEAADKIREAATKHMYAGGESGGGTGFGTANKLTEDSHEATKAADTHKVAWLHHAAVNAHLKASQAWRDEADNQGDEGLKKVLGTIAADHQKQAWEHGKSASQAEVGGSTKVAPKGAGGKKYEFLKPSTNQLGLKPTLLQVENWGNPFHDIKGKFTSAGSAVGGAIGATIGAAVGRTYGGLKERTWGRKLPIAFGEAYSKRGRNKGRDTGENIGGGIGTALGMAATAPYTLTKKIAGLASTGWEKAKPKLAELGRASEKKAIEFGETFEVAGKGIADRAKKSWSSAKLNPLSSEAWKVRPSIRVLGGATVGAVGGSLLGGPVGAVMGAGLGAAHKVSSATLLHGLAGGKEAIAEAVKGKPSLYSPSVSPTNPAKTGQFGAGKWGPEYYGAVGSTSAKGVHTFSLDAQKAATSQGINLLVTGDRAQKGIDMAQEAYRDAQLGNHGLAAEKHVKAAELLQKSADGLKSWHLQALQREAAKLTKKAVDKAKSEHEQKPEGLETPAPIPPAVPISPKALRRLGDRDKQALLLETAAHKNRLAAIMQGNNPETEPARAQSLAAFASERAALKADTSAKYVNAADINLKARGNWEKMAASEHNPLYKATYASLARHHAAMEKEYNEKALNLIKSRRGFEGGSLWDKVEEEEEKSEKSDLPLWKAALEDEDYKREVRRLQAKANKPSK